MEGDTMSGHDVLHLCRPPLKSIWGKPIRHELFRQIVTDKNGRDITSQAVSRITVKTHRGLHHQECFAVSLSDIARVRIQTRRLASLPMRDGELGLLPDLATILQATGKWPAKP